MQSVFFAIFVSLLAVSQAAVQNPNTLFTKANEYQVKVTALQQNIVSVITGMRFQLSEILKATSNITLDQVQVNLHTIFEMEQPARQELFEGVPTMEPCIVNLRLQLNLVTEMGGYASSNCIKRYDRNVTTLVSSAYEIVREYEGLITVIQMIVLDAFNDKNIYTKASEIENNFVTEYDSQYARWQTMQITINNFLATLQSDITAYNVVLGNCFSAVQADLQPEYDRLIRQADICREFGS